MFTISDHSEKIWRYLKGRYCNFAYCPEYVCSIKYYWSDDDDLHEAWKSFISWLNDNGIKYSFYPSPAYGEKFFTFYNKSDVTKIKLKFG